MPQPCFADLRERVLGPMSTEKVVRWRFPTAFACVRPPSATGFANSVRPAPALAAQRRTRWSAGPS